MKPATEIDETDWRASFTLQSQTWSQVPKSRKRTDGHNLRYNPTHEARYRNQPTSKELIAHNRPTTQSITCQGCLPSIWSSVNNQSSYSSRMCVMNHNWSATKQRLQSLHLQSAAGISRHKALSEDGIRQRGTSSKSWRKDTDQCLQVAISFSRHRRVPSEYSSVETTVAEGGQNPVAGLWGRTLGGNWPTEPTSSYASIDFWCQLFASLATAGSWMSVVAMVG